MPHAKSDTLCFVRNISLERKISQSSLVRWSFSREKDGINPRQRNSNKEFEYLPPFGFPPFEVRRAGAEDEGRRHHHQEEEAKAIEGVPGPRSPSPPKFHDLRPVGGAGELPRGRPWRVG